MKDQVHETTHKIDCGKCPLCDYEVSAVTGSDVQSPSPGAIAFCIDCAGVLVFKDDMTMRAATKEEIIDLQQCSPRFNAMQAFAQRRKMN